MPASALAKMQTTPEIVQAIGTALRARRMAMNLTQAQLAERANVTRLTIHNLENGQGVSLNTLVDVARALDVAHLLIDVFARPDTGFTSLSELEKARHVPKRVRASA